VIEGLRKKAAKKKDEILTPSKSEGSGRHNTIILSPLMEKVKMRVKT